MLKNLLLISLSLILYFYIAGCSSISKMKGRVFLDSSSHKDSPPEWVLSTKTAWNKDGKIQIKASHTIRGDERINACFDLVQMDVKEAVLSEIANDVRGRIDNAIQSISENAEVILGKVRSAEFQGRISGLRFIEEYFERYVIDEVERISCYTLGEISEKDYKETKRAIVHQIIQADPMLRKAIQDKQIDFFDSQISNNAAQKGLTATEDTQK